MRVASRCNYPDEDQFRVFVRSLSLGENQILFTRQRVQLRTNY